MKKRGFIAIFTLLLLLQGCSQKSFVTMKQRFEELFTPQKEARAQYAQKSGSSVHPYRAKKQKRVQKKGEKKSRVNFKKFFTTTAPAHKPINPQLVVDFNSPKVPKECRAVGWLSVSFPKGLNVKTVIFKELYLIKRKEWERLRNAAAKRGIRYINSYFDTSKSRFVKVYDPMLKREVLAQLTPFKRVIIYNGKLYREAVRVYRCKEMTKKSHDKGKK